MMEKAENVVVSGRVRLARNYQDLPFSCTEQPDKAQLCIERACQALEEAPDAYRLYRLSQMAEPVPLVIRNAPTTLMQQLDYGKGYQYAHNAKDKLTNMQCLPDSLLGREYYQPTEQGVEGRFKARLESIKQWKKEHSS